MKNILIIGAGVMGSAFTIPCTDNRNNVILVGTPLENHIVENKISYIIITAVFYSHLSSSTYSNPLWMF